MGLHSNFSLQGVCEVCGIKDQRVGIWDHGLGSGITIPGNGISGFRGISYTQESQFVMFGIRVEGFCHPTGAVL